MNIDDGRVVNNFIAQALRGEALTVQAPGTQTRSFCYVSRLPFASGSVHAVHAGAALHCWPSPSNAEFTEYTNLEECISFLCDYITEHGPFDGLLGFSQGATLSGLILGYQAQGKILQNHPPLKFFISISGSKFRDPIKVKSVHFIGDKDWLKVPSEDLASAFHNPLIIRHPQGHTVPRLDENTIEQLREWTKMILLDENKLAEDNNDPKTANASLALRGTLVVPRAVLALRGTLLNMSSNVCLL